MSFFQGASNITINGGQFNLNVRGENINVFNDSHHETNFNSKNLNNNRINDSFNDNSQRHGGGNTRPRTVRNHREDDEMNETYPTSCRRGEEDQPPKHLHAILCEWQRQFQFEGR